MCGLYSINDLGHTMQVLTNVWACTDCMILHANGDEPIDRDPSLPAPLSMVPDEDTLTMGLLEEEHAESCTREDRAEGLCDCEEIPFSTSPCDTCGDWYAGVRHAMTIWHEDLSPRN